MYIDSPQVAHCKTFKFPLSEHASLLGIAAICEGCACRFYIQILDGFLTPMTSGTIEKVYLQKQSVNNGLYFDRKQRCRAASLK